MERPRKPKMGLSFEEWTERLKSLGYDEEIIQKREGEYEYIPLFWRMYADWKAEREVRAKVYAAGMETAEAEIDRLIREKLKLIVHEIARAVLSEPASQNEEAKE